MRLTQGDWSALARKTRAWLGILRPYFFTRQAMTFLPFVKAGRRSISRGPWKTTAESSRLALGKESTKTLGAEPERPITLDRSMRSFIKIRNTWIDFSCHDGIRQVCRATQGATLILARLDRKSTRLNSSHLRI